MVDLYVVGVYLINFDTKKAIYHVKTLWINRNNTYRYYNGTVLGPLSAAELSFK